MNNRKRDRSISCTHFKLKIFFSQDCFLNTISKRSPLFCLDGPQNQTGIEYIDPSLRRRNAILASFVEALVSLSYATILQFFLPPGTNWYKNPFLYACASSTVNLILRLLEKPEFQCPMRTFRSFIFVYMDYAVRYILVHETGHAIAVRSLFLNNNPKITVNPTYMGLVFSGHTNYTATFFTPLANKIDDFETIQSIIAASGPAATAIVDYMTLIVAQIISDDYPDIKSYLRFSVLFSMIHAAHYMLSSYYHGCKEERFDGCTLEANGISPGLITFVMLTTYAMVQLSLSCISKRVCCKKQIEEVDDYEFQQFNDDEQTNENTNDGPQIEEMGSTKSESVESEDEEVNANITTKMKIK